MTGRSGREVAMVSRRGQAQHGTVGLRQRATGADGAMVFDAGRGDAIGLMPAADGARSKHTVLSFEVPDLAGEIRDLESRGVRFEDYNLPNLKTVDHIAEMGGERAAWFCDSEGNILCLHEAHS